LCSCHNLAAIEKDVADTKADKMFDKEAGVTSVKLDDVYSIRAEEDS